MKEKVKDLLFNVSENKLEEIDLSLSSHPVLCVLHILIHVIPILSYMFIRIIIQYFYFLALLRIKNISYSF